MNKPTTLLAFGIALAGAASTASADPSTAPDTLRRSNGLENQPAVRSRRLLVSHRLELTPLFESSIDADFQHTVGGGLKLEYHFSDMWSLGVIGVGSASFHTGLVD